MMTYLIREPSSKGAYSRSSAYMSSISPSLMVTLGGDGEIERTALCSAEELRAITDYSEESLLGVLRAVFGFSSFRAGQLEAI